MNAQRQAESINVQMDMLGQNARAAAHTLALASSAQKNAALSAMASEIRQAAAEIELANQLDVAGARQRNLKTSFIDRLTLNSVRIEAIAQGLEAIATLPDPVGATLSRWDRPNGLNISRVRVPIGVIGVIYESRPNVTADAGALCMKSGNAAILRGGSDSLHSSAAITNALRRGLDKTGLPIDAIQLVESGDRDCVGRMLEGLNGNIDLIVPRGGKSLVARVQEHARVPVFAHLEGICHVYVHANADLEMAKSIVLNAKMRRTGICGAAETILIDRQCQATHLRPITQMLLDAGCAVRGDALTQHADSRVEAASEQDWSTEYLDAIVSIGVVDDLDAAMKHIARYGSQHTDAIVTNDSIAAMRFLNEVDSAIVLHNASTQFADGGEFGFGAEIGIATGKLHARGPVGLEQLTTFKYQVRGNGQVRPG